MLIGTFCAIFVTIAGLTLSAPAAPAAPAARHAREAGGPAAREHAPSPPAGELYSLRARRRFAAYLRLRLLEMRKAGLVRAADVVERRLPVDTLVGR